MFPSPQATGFTVYSKDDCKYCKMVKEILEPFPNVVIIDCEPFLVSQKEEFLQFIEGLAKKPHRTFPMVFHNGLFVGGFLETFKLCDTLEE